MLLRALSLSTARYAFPRLGMLAFTLAKAVLAGGPDKATKEGRRSDPLPIL